MATLKSLFKSALPLLSTSQVHDVSPTATLQIILAGVLAYHCYPSMLSLKDILFVVLYPSYLMLANHYRFDNNAIVRQRSEDNPHSVTKLKSKFFSGSDSPWFIQRYMPIAATFGVILPLFTFLLSSNKEVATLAVPHLFVLWCQIIGESTTMFNPNAHLFITLLLPLGFSIYRMNLLVEWFLASVSLVFESSTSSATVWGLVLSSLNLVFWTYNLFVMLLLRITPEFLSDDKCESPSYMVSIPPLFVQETTKAKIAEKSS